MSWRGIGIVLLVLTDLMVLLFAYMALEGVKDGSIGEALFFSPLAVANFYNGQNVAHKLNANR